MTASDLAPTDSAARRTKRDRRGRPRTKPSDLAAALSQLEQDTTLANGARADYAEAMGEAAPDVSFLQVNWATVMQRGGRGDVSFGYWRAKRQFKLEDLGIVAETAEQRQALNAVLDLPRGRLLVGSESFDPIHEASSIESRGRTLLKLYSIPSGLGPFIPLGEIDSQHEQAGWHYREFKAAMAAVERDFFAVRDRMGQEWDALTSQTIAYWAAVGDKLYGDLLRAGRLPTRGDIGLYERADTTPSMEEWVGWFLNTRVRPYMLSRDEAMRSFRFSWSVQPILPPQALLEAEANAAMDAAETELRQDMIARTGDVIDQFYRDVVGEMRVRLLENCSAALKAMGKNSGKLPARTQTGIRALIEYLEAVKVWPDREIEEQIAEMRAALDLPASVREAASDELQGMFKRIAAEAQLTLQELDRAEMRSTRELNIDLEGIGVPEDGPELERLAGRSRRSLDIDSEPVDDVTLINARRTRGRALD